MFHYHQQYWHDNRTQFLHRYRRSATPPPPPYIGQANRCRQLAHPNRPHHRIVHAVISAMPSSRPSRRIDYDDVIAAQPSPYRPSKPSPHRLTLITPPNFKLGRRSNPTGNTVLTEFRPTEFPPAAIRYFFFVERQQSGGPQFAVRRVVSPARGFWNTQRGLFFHGVSFSLWDTR
jgi:hypothetical protein